MLSLFMAVSVDKLNLLPHLLPFNGYNPNSVVVLDNASVQKSGSCVGAFLPPRRQVF